MYFSKDSTKKHFPPPAFLFRSKYWTSLLLFFCVFFHVFSTSVLAHPLDISSTTFTVYESRIEAITYFHPSEVEAIIGKSGVNMRSLTYGDYYEYGPLLYEYVRQKVLVRDSK